MATEMTVCFGSTAVVHHPISSTSAFGGIAAIKSARNHDFERPESVTSGRFCQFQDGKSAERNRQESRQKFHGVSQSYLGPDVFVIAVANRLRLVDFDD